MFDAMGLELALFGGYDGRKDGDDGNDDAESH